MTKTTASCLAALVLAAAATGQAAPIPASLGEAIFRDTSLSSSGKMACSTCHDPVRAHAQDNDPQHLQEHMTILQSGDPTGVIRAHIQEHQHQMKLKEQAQAQAMMQQQGGPPGGGTPGGAQVVGPHAPKGPPGAINADQMARAGAPGMPRKM